jgi:hypothetical protein
LLVSAGRAPEQNPGFFRFLLPAQKPERIPKSAKIQMLSFQALCQSRRVILKSAAASRAEKNLLPFGFRGGRAGSHGF